MSETGPEPESRRGNAYAPCHTVKSGPFGKYYFALRGSMNADLRLALGQMGKASGLALTALLTLSLAIGANAVVFRVLNALVLRPLDVPHSGNLFIRRGFRRAKFECAGSSFER